jgi:hypothetical protein
MSLTLTAKDSKEFVPHPEGIHPAVCVDVIELGEETSSFNGGPPRTVNKIKIVFESEQKTKDGVNCSVSKNFTASLHPKAKLADFLGKWRGRPLVIGETIDLQKLIGACCTLVISHQQNMVGRTYASIDAISKPTKKLTPSGSYDPAATRQRLEEWKAKQNAGMAQPSAPSKPVLSAGEMKKQAAAPVAAPEDPGPTPGLDTSYDPEVGF